MGTLYELNQQYRALLEMALDDEIDPQAIADTMEGMEGEIGDKLDGYAHVLKELGREREALKAQADYITKEADRLKARAASIEEHERWMKSNMQNMLEVLPDQKMRTSEFTFYIQKNTPKTVYTCEDVAEIPEEFLKLEIDKTLVTKALKDGSELDFAHLEQSSSIRIR